MAGIRRVFTLIELMIVIVIIAIVAAIAIPNILESRKYSNEGAAIGAIRSIGSAQVVFRDTDREADGLFDYGSLPELQTANLVDDVLGSGTRNGYVFQTDGVAGVNAQYQFWLLANPQVIGRTGDRGFVSNQLGAIYYTTAPPIPIGTMSVDAAIPAGVIPIN